MTTNNCNNNNNMKTIPLVLSSLNSYTILFVTKVDEMFRIERLYANRKIKTIDTYVNTKEDVIKIIDTYIDIQDSLFQYKEELAYDVGFDNDILRGETNKNTCKERVRDLVELVGKLYRKNEKESMKKHKKRENNRRRRQNKRNKEKDREKQKSVITMDNRNDSEDEEDERRKEHEQYMEDYYNLYKCNGNSNYDIEKEYFLIDYFTHRCKENEWRLCNTYDHNEYNRYKVEENSLNELIGRRTRRNIYQKDSDSEDDEDDEDDERSVIDNKIDNKNDSEDDERRQRDKHMESYRCLTEKSRSSLVDFIEEEHLREEEFLINYFTQRSKERDRKQSYSDDIENEKKEEMVLFDLLETRRARE